MSTFTPPKRWAHFIEVATPNGCWLWTGSLSRDGYGLASSRDEHGNGRTTSAHRAVYRLCVGPIPDGLQLDHLCHSSPCPGGRACVHRRCVNPAHLEPVTLQENHRRMRSQRAITACPNGHIYDDTNTYLRPSGSYYCRTCKRERRGAYEARKAVSAGLILSTHVCQEAR